MQCITVPKMRQAFFLIGVFRLYPIEERDPWVQMIMILWAKKQLGDKCVDFIRGLVEVIFLMTSLSQYQLIYPL